MRGVRRRFIAHDDIGLGRGCDAGQVFGREIGGAQNDPARHPVELEQRRCRDRLLMRREQHGSIAQRFELAGEAGPMGQVGHRDRAAEAVELQ